MKLLLNKYIYIFMENIELHMFSMKLSHLIGDWNIFMILIKWHKCIFISRVLSIHIRANGNTPWFGRSSNHTKHHTDHTRWVMGSCLALPMLPHGNTNYCILRKWKLMILVNQSNDIVATSVGWLLFLRGPN